MKKQNIILIIVILILLVGNLFFAVKCFGIRTELEKAKQTIKAQQINEKILDFTNLFIDKVLKAEVEVSFEERLQLENAVRALEDDQILNQWNKFVESKTEEEAQKEVKNLLEMLVTKISY